MTLETEIQSLAAQMGASESDTLAFLAGLELQMGKGLPLEAAIVAHQQETQKALLRGLDRASKSTLLAREFVTTTFFQS